MVAKEAVKTFMKYQKFRQWNKIWEMLHPDSQGLFNKDKDEYTTYMEARPFSIESFTIGSVEVLPRWTFQCTEDVIGTDKTYSSVTQMQVTMIASGVLDDMVINDIEISWTSHAIKIDDNWKLFSGMNREYFYSKSKK